MSSLKTRVTIVGVGLIGGSLALSFKQDPNVVVTGVSSRPDSVDKYLRLGVVDSATTDMEEAVTDADFIFLCMPVGLINGYLERLHQLPLKQGCIITDVGSTKGSVVRFASGLSWNGAVFIGGHPMAGSERSGVEAASSELLENAFYVLTPAADVPETACARLERLLESTKAKLLRMDADRHDRIVGAISHLPHIIAAALVNQVARCNESDSAYEQLAAGGFRDITRIASSDPVIWRDILLNNREVLLDLLTEWEREVAVFKQKIAQEDRQSIEALFDAAGRFRSRLPERRKGPIYSVYDLYVDIPDSPGVVGRIASELGHRKINLSNIQIFESREEVPGVLRLTFRNQTDMDSASEVLQEIGYTVRV